MRPSERLVDQLRPITMTRHYTAHAEGSVFVKFGNTHVLCNASLIDGVPRFLKNSKRGWITAEYGMLPRATLTREQREAVRNRQSGRTLEIQRLIGRSLRAAVDLSCLKGYTIVVDCDVIQADGSTRTAAITGAYVALVDAIHALQERKTLLRNPLLHRVAAVSVGIYKGTPILDLDYAEDSQADTDMNVVMNEQGEFIELQGTAESTPFNTSQLDALLVLARKGIKQLFAMQQGVLSE